MPSNQYYEFFFCNLSKLVPKHFHKELQFVHTPSSPSKQWGKFHLYISFNFEKHLCGCSVVIGNFTNFFKANVWIVCYFWSIIKLCFNPFLKKWESTTTTLPYDNNSRSSRPWRKSAYKNINNQVNRIVSTLTRWVRQYMLKCIPFSSRPSCSTPYWIRMSAAGLWLDRPLSEEKCWLQGFANSFLYRKLPWS